MEAQEAHLDWSCLQANTTPPLCYEGLWRDRQCCPEGEHNERLLAFIKHSCARSGFKVSVTSCSSIMTGPNTRALYPDRQAKFFCGGMGLGKEKLLCHFDTDFGENRLDNNKLQAFVFFLGFLEFEVFLSAKECLSRKGLSLRVIGVIIGCLSHSEKITFLSLETLLWPTGQI